MKKALLIIYFILSMHACYAIEFSSSKKKHKDGPQVVEEPKPMVSPNGPPPPKGYYNE